MKHKWTYEQVSDAVDAIDLELPRYEWYKQYDLVLAESGWTDDEWIDALHDYQCEESE